MSKEKEKKEQEPAIACEICLREIDHEEAETFEVDDYVHHFCGLDCYAKWQHAGAQEKREKGQKGP